jgi:hypothetical protein
MPPEVNDRDNDAMSDTTPASRGSDSTHQSNKDPLDSPKIRLDGMLSSLSRTVESQ